MRKTFFIVMMIIWSMVTGSLFISCHHKVEVTGGDKYLKEIKGFTCKDATIDEYGTLIIGITASDGNFDALARQFLDEAKREGVVGLEGCRVVNVYTYKNLGSAYE